MGASKRRCCKRTDASNRGRDEACEACKARDERGSQQTRPGFEAVLVDGTAWGPGGLGPGAWDLQVGSVAHEGGGTGHRDDWPCELTRCCGACTRGMMAAPWHHRARVQLR